MNRVALIGENSIDYVNALIDIWNNGDCAVLIDWRIPVKSAIQMMMDADVNKCVIQEKYYNSFIDCNKTIQFIVNDTYSVAASLLPSYIYDKYNVNYSEQDAVVIYSSGTTGKAKGVILSHKAITTNADAIIDYIKPTTMDCLYMVKTISHASSLIGELLVALKTHSALVLSPIVVPPRYSLSVISQFRVTIMCLNPTLLQLYAAEYEQNPQLYDISSLKEIYVNGAKANQELRIYSKSVFKSIPIYYEYGLTEAGPRVTTQKNSQKNFLSVGKPLKNVEIAILNEKQNGVKTNEMGVVHIKTTSKYKGYIMGDKPHSVLGEDWINTGDVGYWDEYNELHIVGRLDTVMNIDSHKIYPADVEDAIFNCSEINECVVVKVNYHMSSCIACLYSSPQKMDGNIRYRLSEVLMPYEIPRFFFWCENIPRTINGKISYPDVKKMIISNIDQARLKWSRALNVSKNLNKPD